MQITKEQLRKIIKEVIYSEPEKPIDNESLKKWYAWHKQFFNIAKLLTDKSGYWYVFSSIKKISEKIKLMKPEQLKEFRKHIADLLKLSKVADKTMNDVKKEANALIASLE